MDGQHNNSTTRSNKPATITVYPQQVITTVTVQPNENPPTSDTPGITYVQLRPGYFTTVIGILTIIELVFAIICMACASPAWLPGTNWFLFVVVICFVITLIWTFFHLFTLEETLKFGFSWLSLEYGYNILATILYFTGFVVQFAIWSPRTAHQFQGSNIAAGCFAMFNFVVYALATYMLYKERKDQPK